MTRHDISVLAISLIILAIAYLSITKKSAVIRPESLGKVVHRPNTNKNENQSRGGNHGTGKFKSQAL
jgi:hypothetical protein